MPSAPKFKISKFEQEWIVSEYLNKAFRGKKPSSEKRLTIITGLPGCGKSTAAAKLAEENKNSVTIGCDDFYADFPKIFDLYKKYPSSLNTKEESALEHPVVENFATEAFEQVIGQALARGYNVIADVQPNDSLLVYLSVARELGYQIDVKFAVAPKRQIETNIVSRYIDGVYRFEQALEGRKPQTGKNIPHHFSQLRVPKKYVEEIKTLLNRIEKKGISVEVRNYLNDVSLHSGGEKDGAAAAFEAELSRPLNASEKIKQKAVLMRLRLQVRRLKLRHGEWRTTERPSAEKYENQTGHEKYYQHVINSLER